MILQQRSHIACVITDLNKLYTSSSQLLLIHGPVKQRWFFDDRYPVCLTLQAYKKKVYNPDYYQHV